MVHQDQEMEEVMSRWEEVKTWIFKCDGCKSIVRKVDTEEPFADPIGWHRVERSGGGHYGLPIHTDYYCPKCIAAGRAGQ